MDEIRVKMPKEANDLIEDLRTVIGEKAWIFLNNEAVNFLTDGNEKVRQISNFLKIPCGPIEILAGPHTTDWWRIYDIEGEISFREEANPDVVVFIKG